MKLLHVVPSIDPRQGGVAESIRTRGLKLVELGHFVEVASLDAPNSPAAQDYALPLHALGPAIAKWSYSSRLVPWLRKNAMRFDAIVVDGIWQFHAVAVWRVLAQQRVPYFVLPHGMLGSWFKRTHPFKHAKKWVSWLLFEYWILRDATCVLFASEEERVQAGKSFWLYRARERVLSVGTAPPPLDREQLVSSLLAVHPALARERVVLFLGRIHKIKGVDVLIQAFARVAVETPDLRLAIAGPGDEALLNRLRQLTRELEMEKRVTWMGMLDAPMKWGALYASAALALPSHHENFGVVVAEAMACGVPVLISDQVSIWREIDACGGGFVAPDTIEGTERNLRRWLALDDAALVKLGNAAHDTYERHFRIEAMAESLVDAINSGLRSRSRLVKAA